MGAWPWLLLLALISFLGGIATGWGLLQHLAYGVAAVVLLGLGAGLLSGRGLRLTGSVSRRRVTAGESVEQSFEIEGGRGPAYWLELENDDGVSRPISLRSSRRIMEQKSVPARGAHLVGGAWLRVRDPMGLFALSRHYLEPSWVIAHPRPIATKPAAQLLGRILRARTRSQLVPADATLGDLRAYKPGDPPARIHWKSTARTGRMLVTEPESDPEKTLWLLVDCGGTDAEECLGLAAYLVIGLSRSDCSVGLIAGGRTIEVLDPIPARRGSADILDALALVETCPTSRLEQILSTAATDCPRTASVILVSAVPLSETGRQTVRRFGSLETLRPDAGLSRSA